MTALCLSQENWDVKGDQALIKRIVIIVSAYLIETSENLAVLLLYLSQVASVPRTLEKSL